MNDAKHYLKILIVVVAVIVFVLLCMSNKEPDPLDVSVWTEGC
jgi:hypothetical protein